MERGPSLLERRMSSARAEIVDIALELFVRDGFDATTVEAIAAAAGCSPRTFYRYFGSKEDVMFHDLPQLITALGEVLDANLDSGLSEWAALTESLAEFIARFDATDERTPTRRMDLWLHEPALLARYLQYVAQAEQVVLDCLCRHRGTNAYEDDLANLMALASVGAYRICVTTQGSQADRTFAEHLRHSLSLLGVGLEPEITRDSTPRGQEVRQRSAAADRNNQSASAVTG
jgi:AcrR family transcriptional regulator